MNRECEKNCYLILRNWIDGVFQSLLWLTLLFVRLSSQLLMAAKLEIHGLKYSVLDIYHMMIFGQVSFNYSNSSENEITKKINYFDYGKNNLYKLLLKQFLSFSLREVLRIWQCIRILNFTVLVQTLNLRWILHAC